MAVVIKEFNELSVNELYDIVKARFQVFIMEQNIICEQDLDDLDKLCHHAFIYKNNKVIAYARIVPKGLSYEETSIGRVLVLKEYRRRGIAKKLLTQCVNFIKNELHQNSIKISAQVYAQNLYGNLGFKSLGESYNEVGISHIKMVFKN